MTKVSLLGCAVVALLVAATSALALGGADDGAPDRLQPASSSGQLLLAVDPGPQAVFDPGPGAPPSTVAPAPPPPPTTTDPAPQAGRASASAPPAAGPPARAKPPSKQAAPGANATRCAQYGRGGSVHPLCAAGKGGAIANVVVEKVAGTNVVVNKAWTANVSAFFRAARAAGFDLGAWDVAGPGYGSFRTAAMQHDLRRRGFPANPPGESMHEWGLAIDLSCNGVKFLDAPPRCRDWVRANAGRFGISNLPSEAWHWSSNGR